MGTRYPTALDDMKGDFASKHDFAAAINAIQTKLGTGATFDGANVTFIGARVHRTTNQSINDATETAVAFTAEAFDTTTFHDNSTNNSRLTVPTTGYYALTGQVRFASNATGVRVAFIKESGSDYHAVQRVVPVTGATTIINLSTVVQATAADYFELMAEQSSGGALDVEGLTTASIGAGTWFAVQWLGV